MGLCEVRAKGDWGCGSPRSDITMAMMAARGFRHLPVLDAGKVVGVISIGDVVKDIIRNLEHNVGDLMGYIMLQERGRFQPLARRTRLGAYRFANLW